jgi:hypothetical protein
VEESVGFEEDQGMNFVQPLQPFTLGRNFHLLVIKAPITSELLK